MATLNATCPTALLGRYVTGCYLLGGVSYSFSGPVEAVVMPAPGSAFQLEFYVSGEYVALADCERFDVIPPSAVLPVGQLGAKTLSRPS